MPRLPLLTLAALLLTVSACGTDDGSRPETAVSAHTRAEDGRREQRAQPGPSESAAPTAPSSSPERRKQGAKPSPVLGQPLHRPALESHLLSVALMPAPAEAGWTRASDITDPDPVAVGVCHKTDLTTIGALSTVRRTFTSGPGGAVGTQVVAEFADPKSAWRAHEVLRAWQADCAERLDFAHTEVGPLRSVRVSAGTGESYRATYGPEAAARGRATGLGILRQGSHLSVVEISTARTAYPSERDPSRMAVRRIARTFA